jgi:hypothetical protein
MDNAGENQLLAARIKHKDWKLPIIVECTARDTSQQNSPAEVGIATIAGRARAMLQDANIPVTLRKRLMLEAVKAATLLDGLIPIVIDGISSTKFVLQFGKNPSFAKFLRTWGEAGTVTIKSRKFQPKEKGRGVTCLMVGYSPDHSAGTYRMFDPNTNGIHITRDVTWLRRKFYQDNTLLEAGEGVVMSLEHNTDNNNNNNQPSHQPIKTPLSTDDEEDLDRENKDGEAMGDNEAGEEADDDAGEEVDKEAAEELGDAMTTRSGRIARLPACISENYETANTGADDYKIELTPAEEKHYTAMQMEVGFSCVDRNGVEAAMVGAGVGEGFASTNELHTIKYADAMASTEKPFWLKAIDEEYKNLSSYGGFKPVATNSIPQSAKVLSTTWVIKKKPPDDTRRASPHGASNKRTENILILQTSRLLS